VYHRLTVCHVLLLRLIARYLGHVSSAAASGWVVEGASMELAFVADELPLEKI